jgi:hypothetical protein
MTASKFRVGDRVSIKHSKMLGKIVSVEVGNPLGAFVYPFKTEAAYSVSFDEGNDGLAFSFGESMLEPESPVESLAQVGREGRAGRVL